MKKHVVHTQSEMVRILMEHLVRFKKLFFKQLNSKNIY